MIKYFGLELGDFLGKSLFVRAEHKKFFSFFSQIFRYCGLLFFHKRLDVIKDFLHHFRQFIFLNEHQGWVNVINVLLYFGQ